MKLRSWLLYILLILCAGQANAQVVVEDSLALVKIFIQTNGPSWNHSDNWLDTNVALWYGVTVRDSFVVELDLSDNNLQGMMDLAGDSGLIHLEKIDLSDNPDLFLSAEMKESWFPLLTDLRYLDMSRNQDDMLHLTLNPEAPLQYFAMADKGLSGLPISALNGLKKLVYCDISGNKFEQIPSQILQSPYLQVLKANDNKLQSIDGIDSAQTLRHLNLKNNLIDSIEPIFALNSLQYLNLYANQIYGDIKYLTQNLAAVDTLILGFNDIFGTIDSAAIWLLNVKYLDISTTYITGSINSLFNNVNLQVLIASNNRKIKGTLQGISSLTNLQYLDLSSDSIYGTLPLEINQLSGLRVLSLSNNYLSGQIPLTISSLNNLEHLDLSNNNLSGTVPLGLWRLPNLQYLDLSDNQFSGTVSSTIGNASNLQYLDISGNKFYGPLPDSLGVLNNLRSIDVSNNLFTYVPALNSLPNLEYVFVQKNLLDPQALENIGLSFDDQHFIYMPQRRFPITDSIVSDSVVITAHIRPSFAGGMFYWFNQEQFIKTTSLPRLTVHLNDTGAYYCVYRSNQVGHDSLIFISLPYANNIQTIRGIAAEEYNVLTRFYDELQGNGWNRNDFWLSDTNVEYWHGITVGYGIHVVKIELPDNRLKGKVPALNALKYLSVLNLARNMIDSIPDLNDLPLDTLDISANNIHSLPNLPQSLKWLSVLGNYLQFGDLERVKSQCRQLQNFFYAPQHKVGQYTVMAPILGEPVVLSVDVSGTNNRYNWYKDGQFITGGTSNSLIIPNFQYADTGVYYCEITNDSFPDLTLVSHDIVLLKAYKVEFFVTDTAGKPIPDVNVYLAGYPPATTDSSGYAQILYVREALNLPYTLSKNGYNTILGVVNIDQNVRIDTQMFPMVVRLWFSDRYTPIVGAHVLLSNRQTGQLVADLITDSSGFVQYYPIVDGKYKITLNLKPYKPVVDTFTIERSSFSKKYLLEFNSLKYVQFYPNPTEGQVTIYSVEPQDSLLINLYDRNGNLILSRRYFGFREQTIVLPASLPSGIYLLEAKNAVVHTVRPIILLRRK